MALLHKMCNSAYKILGEICLVAKKEREQIFSEQSSLLYAQFLFLVFPLIFLPAEVKVILVLPIYTWGTAEKYKTSLTRPVIHSWHKKGRKLCCFKKLKVPLVTSDKTIENVRKFHQDRVRVYTRKNVFIERAVKLWNRVPRDVVHPSL